LSEDTVLFGIPVDTDDAKLLKPHITETDNAIAINLDIIDNTTNEEAIIPILSVLNAKSDNYTSTFLQESENQEINDDIKIDNVEIDIITDDNKESNDEFPEENYDNNIPVTQEFIIKKEIGTIINDDMPTEEAERTLEGLLETMTLLREDYNSNMQTIEILEDISDVTLEQLANEFAEKQDSIKPNEKSESTGKIGKLKNILPFKKAKKEDSNLMGDLFGWAGIAANDEEFSMPDFFSGNAYKK
jgi:hypothetical protein